MKYVLNGTYINDETANKIPDGASRLTDAEWNNRRGTPYEPTLNEKKEQLSRKIKAEAQRRILTRLPGATVENYRDKELNYLGRQMELDAIVLGTYRDATGVLQAARALTAFEITEVAVFRAFWEFVKANRSASNLIESDGQAAGYTSSFDYMNSPRWPT